MRTLVSKKLRALMNLVPIEAPSARVPLTRETIELRNASLGIVPTSDSLQVVPNHLIKTLSQRFGFLPGTSHELVFDRQSDVHKHMIRAHMLCVNSEARMLVATRAMRTRYFCSAALSFWYAALRVPLLCAIGSSVG